MHIEVDTVCSPATGDSLFQQVLGLARLEYVAIDADGAILRCNAAFARHMGQAADGLLGARIMEFAHAADAARLLEWARGAGLPREPVVLDFVPAAAAAYTVRCVLARENGELAIVGDTDVDRQANVEHMTRMNNEYATLMREMQRRSRELETSYWHLKKIQEALPLCMECGQVKTDGSRWEPVVDYLRSNAIFLSHGYCPCCYDQLVRDLESRGEL